MDGGDAVDVMNPIHTKPEINIFLTKDYRGTGFFRHERPHISLFLSSFSFLFVLLSALLLNLFSFFS